MYNSQEIAQRIKLKAKENNIKLSELLSLCGLGVNTISKMAHGKDILTLNFAKIADHLNCSVDYLLGRQDFVDNYILSNDEQELLNEFRKITDLKGKSAVMNAIFNEQKRIKESSISKDMIETMEKVGTFQTITKQK